jgi:hypothetical protein
VGVVVNLQFFRLVRMIVRTVLPLIGVLMLMRISRMRMFVRVIMFAFVAQRDIAGTARREPGRGWFAYIDL